MYKTILVHVDADDPHSSDRTCAAAHLARSCHGKLIGLAASLPPAMIETIASGAVTVATAVINEERDGLNGRFQAAKAQFTTCVEHIRVESEWRSIVGFPAQCIVATAGRADLIVVGTT